MKSKKKKLKKPSVPTVTKKFDILRVTWNDHWSGQHRWSAPEEVEHKPKLCVTVGINIKEDKDGITLAQNMGTEMQFADTTYVMKNCIVQSTKLGEVSYGKEV